MQTTIETIVRPAVIDDLPMCLDLMYALQEETHWHSYPNPSVAEGTAWLMRRDCIFIAQVDWQYVGICAGSVRHYELFPFVHYLAEDALYVRPAHRRAGIGNKLLMALKQFGRGQKVSALLLGRPTRHGECVRWHPYGGSHV